MEEIAAGRALFSGFLGRGGDRFLGGPKVRELERAFAKRFKVKHAVSVSSATTALQAAVAAAGVGPGDEVVTSPYTMSATPISVLLNGAVPVFADVDPKTYCVSAETIARKITPKTKAIIVVNILGGSAEYAPILSLARRHGLTVIEDNAQAPGATYRGRYTGTVGDIGVFSFNIHKAIQCGEGGMVVTNDDRYAYRAQLARNHGETPVDDMWGEGREKRELMVGSNFRLTELQAVIMIEQLKKLEVLNRKRVELADYLTEKLKPFPWLAPVYVPKGQTHVYYLYPIRFDVNRAGMTRRTFAEALKAEGFPMNEGYNKPLHLLPVFRERRMYEGTRFPFVSSEFKTDVRYERGDCPAVEELFDRTLLVTTLCQPPKTKRTIDLFVKALRKIEANAEALRVYEKKAAR
jgi:dTDP-4-amino-4,6-dideoxygalactose transaminase